MPLPLLVNLAAEWAKRVLIEGDLAIDATVGNGHDTARLARLVGPAGRVLGFDIQAEALTRARKKLQAEGLEDRVHLILDSHANLATWVAPGARPRLVVFNLGYLPGGDDTVTTKAASTLPALKAALDLLLPGGLLIVIVYTTREAGRVEARVVLEWARNIPPTRADVMRVEPLNTRESAPVLLLIEARGDAAKANGDLRTSPFIDGYLRPSPSTDGEPDPAPGEQADGTPTPSPGD
ncbi:class I SAM-dependent methyltransferase [Isosphaeraceae bacterium EP7]